MRLLASCTACKRQYDASGMKPADRFRCSCGVLVTVSAPTSAVLAVAHCGTCGAARTTEGRICVFCKSAFADIDLRRDTMCPKCYGQIADTAKFCDHCGLAIQPTRMAGTVSKLPCPSCSDVPLRTRHLPEADHPIEECVRCGGAWLEISLFDQVVDRARAQSTTTTKVVAARTGKPQSGPLYRSCPICREMMNRRNYGGSSAVIIDSCKDHGLWFDADELGRIVAWVRTGGLDRQRERERSESLARKRALETRIESSRSSAPTVYPQTRDFADGSDIVEVGIDVLTRVLGSIFKSH